MKLQDAMALAGWPREAEAFLSGWEVSQAARPAGEVPFLHPDALRWACREFRLSDESTWRVLAAAEGVRANDGLSAVAWYCHERLFLAQDPAVDVRGWPAPLAAMGEHAGLFYALVALSGTEYRRRAYRRLDIPAEVARDSATDLEICLQTEHPPELAGLYGINGELLWWLLLTLRAELFRLGRLQFIPDRFEGRLRAFRHRETRRVFALAEDGCRFRRDGQFDGAGGLDDPDGAWTASLIESERQFLGYPIVPEGRAAARRVRLRKADWQQVLAPGDPVLAIHIPAGPPMTPEACADSFRRALEFFPRYFPEKPFAAFACASWLLDPQIPQLLPETSNLVRFLRRMHVFPWPGGNGEMPWQVRHEPDPRTGVLPAMTAMQRAFYAHHAAGGRFLTGGCFLLADDFRTGGRGYHRAPAQR